MHTTRISAARKILLQAVAALSLFLLAGCDNVTLTDLTPRSVAENPSQIYTFTLRVAKRSNTITGVSPTIVVDGRSFPMRSGGVGEGLYEFEYQLPAGRDRVAYYFLVNFMIEGNNVQTPGEAYTQVETVQIVRRYVLSLEVNRGPVGARISVLGRGFTPQDRILFNDSPARTNFESANSLSFYVPALAPNANYQVSLSSAAGTSPVGTFRVDASSISVAPAALTLRTGDRTTLTFTLPNPAPPGGTLLDVATDVPESIIMPEVIVPQGQTSISVTVEGGKPGAGTLYLKGFGAGEITVPVTISPR
ncbi:MAG: IPT/TIG domain-containing protein [Opitutaceae bacterium]